MSGKVYEIKIVVDILIFFYLLKNEQEKKSKTNKT